MTVAVLLIRWGLEGGVGSSPGAGTTRPLSTRPALVTTRRATTKRRPAKQFYTVQSGDTFGSISAKTGVSIATLEQLNPGVSSNALQVGQKLRVK
ncbi:MAG TPA: LysM domain-containing protein [Gaiellaceae bacterium]|nr:LysM domain-containing protein [Gaiellaceae bacterium]